MKKISAFTLVATLASATLASAATDGTLGATSTGAVGITVNVEAIPASEVQITGLTDITFNNVTEETTPAPQTADFICVFLSTAATYALSITTQNSAGATGLLYNLSETDAISYTWLFTDSVGTTVSSASGTGLKGSSAAGCPSNIDTASLKITPAEAPQFDAIGSDNQYLDTLTLTVSPE